jgi:hypothetical protein
LRSTSEGLEHAVGTSNNILDTADRNIEPLIDDTRAVLVSVDDLLVSLENPRNKSLGAKLLRDPDGKLARHVEGIASNTASLTGSTSAIVAAVDHGDGTLGKLIGDPRVLEDVGKLLSSLASHDIIRGFALWYLDRKGAIHRAGSRDSNRPPRP